MISQLYPQYDYEDLDAEHALNSISERALDSIFDSRSRSAMRALNRAEIRCEVDASPLSLWIYGRPGGEWGSTRRGGRRPPGRRGSADGGALVGAVGPVVEGIAP